MVTHTFRGLGLLGLLGLTLGALLVAPHAQARQGFAPIPSDQTGGKVTGLELRIVRYDGSTNGVIEVDVKNTRNEPTDFSARGLYFVPDANANEAPQRLGAVGPFNVKTAGGWQRKEKMSLAPGDVARLKLDVYCIDSHRASPSSSTGFHVAKDRVPKKVSDKILESAARAAEPYGGVSSPSAKGAVQQQVWKNRDDKWIELDGEGKQEAGKR
jgi:hypothetical protein